MTPSQAKRQRKKPRARPWGECYTDISYRRAVHRACKKAKVPQWSPNRLRHTRASEIRQRYGLEAAQVVLGHTKADVTQVYAERDRRLGEQVALQIG
jgi:integrase